MMRASECSSGTSRSGLSLSVVTSQRAPNGPRSAGETVALNTAIASRADAALSRTASTFSDDGVVEIREHARVQFLDVRVDRLDESREGGIGWCRDRLQLVLLRYRRAELDLRAGEAAREHEIPQRLRMERPHVRDVADEALEECHPARRVQRFKDDGSAGTKLVVGKLENPEEIGWLKVLDHLRSEQAAKRSVRHAFKVRYDVSFGDVEAARAADLDHLVIEIKSARDDPARLQEVEELAASASGVEHVGRTVEEWQIAFQPLANDVLRSAELSLEADVFEGVKRRCGLRSF